MKRNKDSRHKKQTNKQKKKNNRGNRRGCVTSLSFRAVNKQDLIIDDIIHGNNNSVNMFMFDVRISFFELVCM